MTDRDASPNAFQRDMPGTNARTDAEAAIETLRQRGGIFVEAVRATRMAMALTDPSLPGNPIVFANQSFLDLSGYRMDEVLGQQPYFMNGPDTDRQDAERFRQILESDGDGVVETVQYGKHGRRFVATVLLSAFKDEGGRTLHHFLSWSDVTRRVDAEDDLATLRSTQAALKASESRFRTLFKTMGQGYCELELVRDATGQAVDQLYIDFNPAFERLFGIPVVQAKGRKASDVFPGLEAAWTDTFSRVARTGTPERIEHQIASLDRWFEAFAYPQGGDRLVVLYEEVTDRKRAEIALRESEERQAFLLKHSDALRPLADPEEIIGATVQLLCEEVSASRVYYAEWPPGADYCEIRRDHAAPGLPSLVGRYPNDAFRSTYDRIRDGRTWIVDDVADGTFAAAERDYCLAHGVAAWIDVPLVKAGGLQAALFLVQNGPRRWTAKEVALAEETAERTWAAIERSHADAALRASEERNAFLVRFSDAVRGLSDPLLVAKEACRILSEQLGASRTLLAVLDWERQEYVAEWAFLPDGTPAEPSRWPFDEQEPFAREHLAGRAVVYEDVSVDPRIPELAKAAMIERGLQAGIAVPVVVAGKLYAVLNASQDASPRRWLADEVAFVEALAHRAWAEIERARAEAALRKSEERQAFLLKLSGALRPVADAREIQSTTTRLLGAHLGVDRAMYAEVTGGPGAEAGVIRGQYVRQAAVGGSAPKPFPDQFTYETFGADVMSRRYSGEGLAVADVNADPAFDETERAAWASVGVLAAIVAPLVKDGRLVAELGVHSETPRTWTDAEVSLVHEVGERTWAAVERARTEAVLRESEERRGFLLALGDAMRARRDAAGKTEVAARLLGERLTASRVLFAEFDEDRGIADIFNGWSSDGAPGFPAVLQLSDHDGPVLDDLRAGRIVRIDDIGASGNQPAYAAIAALGVHALLSVPLVIDTKLTVNLSIHQDEPRRWTDQDVELVREVAERLWAEVVRARAEAALRESEERFRTLAESIEDVFYITDLDHGTLQYLSSSFERVWGRPVADLEADLSMFPSTLHPDDLPIFEGGKAAQERGETVSTEYRIVRPDGEVRWILDRSFPVGDHGSRRSAGVASDITERKQVEEALRESGEQLRLVVENARDYAIFTTDPDGVIDQWYAGAAAVFGWSAEEAIGRSVDMTFTPEDRANGEPAKERETAAREGRAPNIRWHMCKDRGRIFIEGISSAMRDPDGTLTGFLKVGQDVTERRRADERQKTLLAELQHRVRNILAMTRSVARRTGETAESVEDYVQHIEGRISAMARTQVLLTRSVGAAVDLEGLILDELKMQTAMPGQYRLAGPEVKLPGKAAEVLGLAVHELATNAVKYGALHAEDGRIDVRWALTGDDETPKLRLTWSEYGVRMSEAPTRAGFGTELITERVPYELNGTGTMEYRTTGLVATIAFPLDDTPSILQTDDGLGET